MVLQGRRRAVVWVILVMVGFTTACGRKPLLPAPDRLTGGVVIYQDINFQGAAALLTEDVPFLRGYESPCVDTVDSGDDPYFSVGSHSWSNCLSSIRVAPGWKAILYADTDFKGAHAEVTSDVPDLRQISGCGREGFNDCVSSVRVVRVEPEP